MVIISLSLPGDLLEKLDEYVSTRGYASRSEAIRNAIREALSEFELTKLERGRAVSVIAVLYSYERTDSDEKLAQIRRELDALITNDLHIHLGRKYCLELIIAEGEVSEIEKLIGRIRGMHGIISVKHSTLSIVE